MGGRMMAAAAVMGLLLGSTVAYAGISPEAKCSDKKFKFTGKNALDLFKAFGKNKKKMNVAKLTTDISKAQSKLTKGFTKAEYTGKGAAKGCDTSSDAGAIEAKVDDFVQDIISALDGCPSSYSFTTTSPTGVCGRINDDFTGGGTDLTPFGAGSASLDCGTLYLGGGFSVQPPSATPAGAVSRFNQTADCSTDIRTLTPTTSAQTGSNLDCSSPGCFFGPPLPVPNVGATSTSTCVINMYAASPAATGSIDTSTGAATQVLPLSVGVFVSTDLEAAPGIQACPTCTGGTCNSGANSGAPCVAAGNGTSHDCHPVGASLAPFSVDLSPLTTATTTVGDVNGDFCGGTTGQRTNGCFGSGALCEYIEENGMPPLSGVNGPKIIGSVFCIPSSGSGLIDIVSDLPGPGAVTLTGVALFE